MVPLAHPQHKQHLHRFSRFCAAHRRASLYFTTGRLFPLKIAPSPHLVHGSLSPPKLTTQTASRSVEPFLHNSRLSIFLHFTMGCPSPLKIAPFHEASGPHLNLIRGFWSQREPIIQTAFRSAQPFLQGSQQWQTDRQTAPLDL